MDTTSLKLLAQAVQKMAWTPEAVRSNLRALRSRGILPEITTRCFAGEEDENACCNPESDVPDEDEDGDGNDGTIDGERPDDGENEKGMDGRYRGPDGELVPWEAATECVPDDSWEAGYFWTGSGSFGVTGKYPSPRALYAAFPDRVIVFNTQEGPVYGTKYDWGYESETLTYIRYLVESSGSPTAPSSMGNRGLCSGPNAQESYCTLTEPPCVEGEEDWPSDGKCQEALINGKYVPHPKDPDCASKAPKDNQIMCQGEGEARRCIAYIPMKGGGHMRIDVDPATRLPTSDSVVQYWGSDAKYDRSESYYYRNVQNKAYSPDSIPGTWN
ncbi:hypothetical protein [Marinobacterium stanieri]|uniref:Uncharacterized protein n=1 Tax=Marinobacterium stanieri TaxID=49186 RepID=A0A1N6QAR9_9GAMM|nr:hypothetical protein [Marinobacterium stanieri]SIQ13651.1 hypothetical protein SAMN05421647_102381 [Marinobacterium stanieri]